jgi:branched-chain amino acid transport system substrate-binding protein
MLPAVAAAVLSFGAASAAEFRDVDVIDSLTGMAAMYGRSGQQALQLVEKVVNADNGIAREPLRFVFHDDETSPQVAVQIANQIIATNAPAMLGPFLAAQCGATAALVSNGPVLYCLSPALQPPAGSYAFVTSVPTTAIFQVLLSYFHNRGWDRIGMITTEDAMGQDSARALTINLALPELKGMSVIDTEYFSATDVSVAAQIEHLRAAKPQALLAFTTGAAIGTILRAMVQADFDVPVATSTGNELYGLMKQYAAMMPKELYFASEAGSARGDGIGLSPATEAAKRTYRGAFEAIGLEPDSGSDAVWDPAMIVVDALRHLGPDPTAAKVRDYIAAIKDYDGVAGHYDFVTHPQRGLGAENVLVVRWNAKDTTFQAVSRIGGAPLP